jgi:hypothetical protein
MSEGDKWVWKQTASLCRTLREGPSGKPIEAAEKAIRSFTTKELGKADLIAALED